MDQVDKIKGKKPLHIDLAKIKTLEVSEVEARSDGDDHDQASVCPTAIQASRRGHHEGRLGR